MLSCHLATVPVRSKKEISNLAILGFTFLPGLFPVLSLVITQSDWVVRAHFNCTQILGVIACVLSGQETVQCTAVL